jgi:hypothetical protein
MQNISVKDVTITNTSDNSIRKEYRVIMDGTTIIVPYLPTSSNKKELSFIIDANLRKESKYLSEDLYTKLINVDVQEIEESYTPVEVIDPNRTQPT